MSHVERLAQTPTQEILKGRKTNSISTMPVTKTFSWETH